LRGAAHLLGLAALLGASSPQLARPASTEGPAAAVSPEVARAPRLFLSAAIDVGFLYLRPRLSAGWGEPFGAWIGVDANPIVNGEGLGAWAGLRVALPFIDLRVGARYFSAFTASFLAPAEAYSRASIELRDGPSARWLDLEAELSWSAGFGSGQLYGEHAVTYAVGVSDGYWLYDETLRLVLDPPWAWRQRIGAAFYVDSAKRFAMGPILEVAGSPGRGTVIVRFGGAIRMRVYDDLEVRGTFVPVLASPDQLGLRGADAFLVGIRYLWATD
jgi:hypothetical protein